MVSAFLLELCWIDNVEDWSNKINCEYPNSLFTTLRYDCPLSDKGHAEAAAAGALLKEEGKSLSRGLLLM